MSSPASNNLSTLQPAPSGSLGAGSKRQQQRSLPEQTNQPTSSQRQHQGRGAKSTCRGPNNRQAFSKVQQDDTVHPAAPTSSLANPDSDNTSQAAIPQSRNEPGNSSKHRGFQRAPRGGAGSSGGKYKQRQQIDRLIDGLDGLDIDLVDSMVPTNKPDESGKNRHSTATRKVNLTHLLNNDRRHRGGHNHGSYNDDRGRRRYHYNYYRGCNTVHKFNKQQFLQANCQFVVLPYQDYTIHKVDPDWPVQWDCIEEVKFRQTGTTETTCPICLDPPISAKVTRCGHIFCWTCMLHYLSLCDEKVRQCPICFEPVSEGDLRSVVSRTYSNHSVGEEISMRLMFRRKGCVEIEPYSPDGRDSVDIENEKQYGSQANLLIVDPNTVIDEVVKREQDELLVKLELDRNEPEVCFVEQAMVRLNKRIEELQQLSVEPTRFIKSPLISKHSSEPSTSQKEEKTFLFYQSSDGQHIYLNPLSTKILCHEYGSLENCPLKIRAKVLQMDWISMSDAWRKRFKYLEHLPLTCEFRLIEIDFETSNLVSQDTFALFADQIKSRANERAFRKTEELKRDKIIQIEQDRRIYGIQPSLTINLDNMEQFPSVFKDARNDQVKTADVVGESNDVADQTAPLAGQSIETGNSVEEEASSSVTLSFKEIQERQEAAEAAQSGSQDQGPKSWAKSGVRNAPPSSFAKLLVDAKSSSKQWTRNVNTSMAKQPAAQSIAVQQRQSSTPGASLDPDDGGEELRAPPFRFTLSDMLVTERVSKRSRKRNQ